MRIGFTLSLPLNFGQYSVNAYCVIVCFSQRGLRTYCMLVCDVRSVAEGLRTRPPQAPAPDVTEPLRAETLIVRGQRHCIPGDIAVVRESLLRAAKLGLPMAFTLAQTYYPSAATLQRGEDRVQPPRQRQKGFE